MLERVRSRVESYQSSAARVADCFGGARVVAESSASSHLPSPVQYRSPGNVCCVALAGPDEIGGGSNLQ